MLSKFVIAFLPRSKCILISWIQSLSTVIFEPQYKIKGFLKKSICPAQGWELGTVINNPGLGPTPSEQTERIYSQILFKELKSFPINNWLKDDGCA